ncbi:hypothetical protein Droror1_Dr00012309 [Drosera rotundifolia]
MDCRRKGGGEDCPKCRCSSCQVNAFRERRALALTLNDIVSVYRRLLRRASSIPATTHLISLRLALLHLQSPSSRRALPLFAFVPATFNSLLRVPFSSRSECGDGKWVNEKVQWWSWMGVFVSTGGESRDWCCFGDWLIEFGVENSEGGGCAWGLTEEMHREGSLGVWMVDWCGAAALMMAVARWFVVFGWWSVALIEAEGKLSFGAFVLSVNKSFIEIG